MKLIKQSFEILEQKDFSLVGIKKFIERCGRVCYKSENRITDTSYEKFVDMLVKRNHTRPLEFGTVYLKVTNKGLSLDNYDKNQVEDRYISNPYSKVVFGKYPKYNNYEEKLEATQEVYITTNYRVLVENDWLDDLKYLCKPTEYHAKRYTVHFIISRGIMDEFRTHVGLSHLAESTRYCAYNKDKFGNEITFIIPNWVNTKCPNDKQEGPSVADISWSDAMKEAETSYMLLLNNGWTPQQARSVLPLGIKSELISCGFEDMWDNFFMRRCAKDAHPMAREIAIKVRDKFNELRNETKENK